MSMYYVVICLSISLHFNAAPAEIPIGADGTVYTVDVHAGVRACGRAGVRACGRAGVRACGRAGVRACGHVITTVNNTRTACARWLYGADFLSCGPRFASVHHVRGISSVGRSESLAPTTTCCITDWCNTCRRRGTV